MIASGKSVLHFIGSSILRCASSNTRKSFPYKVSRHLSTHPARPDPSHVNSIHAPADFDPHSAVVYPQFISPEEGKSFIKEASKRMKKRRFEDGHWDSVITGYREVELSIPADFQKDSDSKGIAETEQISDITLPLYGQAIERTRMHLAAHHICNKSNESNETDVNSVKWLPCHAIDLKAGGKLEAHVDSVKFSGKIVAGISLLSDSIMRLRPSDEEWKTDLGKDLDGPSSTSDDKSCEETILNSKNEGKRDSLEYVDLFLPQFSLYVLSGISRYSYTHELLPSDSQFEYAHSESSLKSGDGEIITVARGRRLSIIFRDAL